MNPPSREKAQSSMSCTPSKMRSSLTWLSTRSLLLHSGQLRRVQLRTEPLNQEASSRTACSVTLLLLQVTCWVRQSEVSLVSFMMMSSGQLAIFTDDLLMQWKRCSGSLVQVRLKEQSLKESSNTKMGIQYWRNIVRIDPNATATQSPKLPVASIRMSSYLWQRWKTSQSEETAGQPVRYTMMMLLVASGSLGSIAWMQMRLPLSEKSRSNLSGMTYPKVGKTLVMGASLSVQISSKSCSSMVLGGLTKMSSPLAMPIFHLQKPGYWVAGDLISASLMGPVLVMSRMTTRSRHCTKSTQGWKSEVQAWTGEKQLTPILLIVRESMRQASWQSRSWWSQHCTISKNTISFTYRKTTTKYCPRNSMDWIFPSQPEGNMMGLASSEAPFSTSQMKTSLGSSSQRMAARWMQSPPQQWNLLAVRLAMRKLMWGAQPLSMQCTSSVQGTVTHLLKWVALLQSCVQRQRWVSSRESYCSCRRKVYLKIEGSLSHQLIKVVFCWRKKQVGGSLSQLSNTPQVMFDPNTYLSKGMQSWPGQLAQQVSGNLRPVGQRASVSLPTTMYLYMKVHTSGGSAPYQLVLSALTMKLNSLLRREGFWGKMLTRGLESWQRTRPSVSMVSIWELERWRSTKEWKLGWGMAAQALRQVLLPRVKTQVDWQATVFPCESVRLAVICATTYCSLTHRSCIQAFSGMEYLVMISGLSWLVQSSSMMAWSWASTSKNSLTMLLEQTPILVNPESVRYLPAMTMVCAVVMSNLMTPEWQSRMQISPRYTSKSVMESLSWWRKERSITRIVQGLRGLLTDMISTQVLSSKLSTCSAKQARMRQWQPSSVSSLIFLCQMLLKGTYMSFLTGGSTSLEVLFKQRKQFWSPNVLFFTQSTSTISSALNHTASKQRIPGSLVTTASLVRTGIDSLAGVAPHLIVVSLLKLLIVTRVAPHWLPSQAR